MNSLNKTATYFAEDFGMCELCDNFTPQDECARCGEEVCVYCHPEIGCDL